LKTAARRSPPPVFRAPALSLSTPFDIRGELELLSLRRAYLHRRLAAVAPAY
jgi:hypothetical protein